MIEFLQRLWRRKLVQWPLAYVAAAFALTQMADVVGNHFGWPAATARYLILALAVGFFVALVLTWYHGERGAQRFGSSELLIIALLLAIGGLAVGHFGPPGGGQRRPTSAGAVAPDRVPGPVAGSSALVAAIPIAGRAPIAAVQPIPAKSIAVLPFENLSSDKENEYFVSGMQDLILAKLADIGELKVISRTSTMQYKSRPENLKTVAAELGVATILEGSVQKQGKRVLVSVQLIDTKTDTHMWAETYQRTLDDIFGVEGEVADKIAMALNAKLSPAQVASLAAVPTTNQAAYDLFLRAEYLANRGQRNYDITSFKEAIPMYRRAVRVDPQFAVAYARLSWSENFLGWFGGAGEEPDRLFAQAQADAAQALRLGPNLAAAQVALGYSLYYGRNDYPAALAAFNSALALRPNDVDALAARALIELRLGRFDAAMASQRQALAHDPRNSMLASDIGGTLMMMGRYTEAAIWLQRALALDPDNLLAKFDYSTSLGFENGDMARALRAAEGDAPLLKELRVLWLTYQRRYHDAIALLDSVPDVPDVFLVYFGSKSLQLAELYRLAGDTTRARRMFREALPLAYVQTTRQRGMNAAFAWLNVARAHLGLGERAKGLDAITRAGSGIDRIRDTDEGMARRFTAALYAEGRRPELAIPLLARALALPGVGDSYSPVLLWLDPAWDPIRDDPGFQALLQQYAKFKPAVIYVAPVAARATSADTGITQKP